MKSLKKDSVYLGAPLFMSKAPTKDFKYLQDRCESCFFCNTQAQGSRAE